MIGADNQVFVIRSKCGAFLISYEGDGYVVGKKRAAKQFATASQASQAIPMWGNWEVVGLEKSRRQDNHEAN